jgi:NAD(P)-dependent dehydrogenase (short-subunit alcohol dehydrogenase family)
MVQRSMARDVRVILVTGSTDGIGKETALSLARAGARVIVHGRNRPRVEQAVADVRAAVDSVAGGRADVDGVSFDLGSLSAVRAGAAEVSRLAPRLDALINNAGIFVNERLLTQDGAELTFAVSHLGAFLLTELLTPNLRAAAPGRVINVSSIAHTRGTIHLDDLTLARNFTGYTAYAQAKLANVMHARSLAERHPAAELAAYSLHPGVIATKLLREGFGPVRGASAEQGARTPVMLALADEIDAPSGSYFSEGSPTPAGAAAQDDQVRRALWSASERLVGT